MPLGLTKTRKKKKIERSEIQKKNYKKGEKKGGESVSLARVGKPENNMSQGRRQDLKKKIWKKKKPKGNEIPPRTWPLER